MRLFKRGLRPDPADMTAGTDPRLVSALRALNDQWGRIPVALTASYLSDVRLVRDLLEAEVRHISFESNREFADQDRTRRGTQDEVAGCLPSGRASAGTESSVELALIRAGHRIAELLAIINAVRAHAKDARQSLVEPDHPVAPVLDDIIGIANSARDRHASGT